MTGRLGPVVVGATFWSRPAADTNGIAGRSPLPQEEVCPP